MRRLIFATVIVFLLCNLTVRSQEDPRNQISGPASIMAGSTAEISWRCMDATAVVLSGDTTTYPPVHTLSLRPTGPITLRFRVFRSTDTSSMAWSVDVRPQDTTRVMRGGSILSYSFAPSLSTGPSSYYRGYDPRGDRSLVSRVRVLRVDPPDSTHDDYLVQAALLDTSGNNIASIPPSALDVVASLTCDGAGPETEARGSDILWTKSPRHVVMTVCMDRSAFARSHDEAVRSAVADFTYSLGSGDQLSVVGYNIETTTVCPHAGKQKLNDLRSMFSGEAEGLSALYRSAYACLGRFDGSGVYENTLVIIASGQDNASLIYSADDVISRARARKTRIFTIGIGDMVDSYILQLLASRTGGRAYFLQDDGIAAITDILREIDYGIHGSYAFRVLDANPAAGSCDTRILSLGLRSASFVSDSVPVLSDKDYSIPHRQLLCLFPNGQAAVHETYLPHIRKLINVLRDNPDKSIELISHTYDENDDESGLLLSDERVRSVRTLLLDSGVTPAAVRCRAMSDVRPLFPYARETWQVELNRSVEVRWLDSSRLPFEIVTDYVESERDAQAAVQTWLKRSYKAYYEPVVVERTPVFRVKLWGYETEAGARDAAALIKKKYNVAAEVE